MIFQLENIFAYSNTIVKKIKLEYTQKFDFLLIGISTSEREYKLIWHLNALLGIQFSKIDNHVLFHKKLMEDQEFSTFNYVDEISYIDYRIIANKSESHVLLEELKAIDYFLIVNGEFDDGFTEDLQSKLRSVPYIQAVFLIDPNSLKSKERLLS